MLIIQVRQMLVRVVGYQLKHFFFFHFTNMQTVCTRSTGRNAGASSLRRRSAYLDALKSTVHTVPLRLFHLFHNTTRLLQSRSDRVGMNASRVLKRTYYAFWYFLFICRCTWKLLQCWMLIQHICSYISHSQSFHITRSVHVEVIPVSPKLRLQTARFSPTCCSDTLFARG